MLCNIWIQIAIISNISENGNLNPFFIDFIDEGHICYFATG
jgi:hypothetical protein